MNFSYQPGNDQLPITVAGMMTSGMKIDQLETGPTAAITVHSGQVCAGFESTAQCA